MIFQEFFSLEAHLLDPHVEKEHCFVNAHSIYDIDYINYSTYILESLDLKIRPGTL